MPGKFYVFFARSFYRVERFATDDCSDAQLAPRDAERGFVNQSDRRFSAHAGIALARGGSMPSVEQSQRTGST
jgi:hypothetical protein